MNIFIRIFLSSFCVLFAYGLLNGQDRITQIKNELEVLSTVQAGLDEEVELSVSKTPVAEFIRGISAAHNLNVSVSPELNFAISNNFSNARVVDVFVFLCKEYGLDIEIIGTIINFRKYYEPIVEEPEKIIPPKIPQVNFTPADSLLTLELNNDSLGKVVREITRKTGINVILGPGVDPALIINFFVKDVSLEQAIQKLAYANKLALNTSDRNIFIIEKPQQTTVENRNDRRTNNRRKVIEDVGEGDFMFNLDDQGQLSISAVDIPLQTIIQKVSQELEKNYFIYGELSGSVSVSVKQTNYNKLMEHLLTGTDYTFFLKDSIYLFGNRSLEKLRLSEIYRFKFRTVENIIDAIPAELKKGVQISEFRDLNALVLSGGKPQINELKLFLEAIDQVVPMIQIEVLIVDVSKSTNLSFGISATLGGDNVPTETSGTILPEYNMTLNSQSINGLLNNFSGFGLVNLGRVTPQFYVNLSALEKDGHIKMKSTPKLSTLNGQEAILSIGQTEYFLQINNSFIGSQNPSLSRQENWQPVNANLSITINPIVSSDDQVTLNISVNQSNFTERVSSTAPPGTVNKDFQSTIRVRNGEMVLLGGLENNSTSNSGDGFPFLSRIPIIKWFFSKRIKEKKSSKFNLFIKPTIY